jgi:hypothetical protein
MRLARRQLLKTLGLAAGALATAGGIERLLGPERPEATFSDELKALAELAIDEARALGCSYADVRIDRARQAAGFCERHAVQGHPAEVRIYRRDHWRRYQRRLSGGHDRADQRARGDARNSHERRARLHAVVPIGGGMAVRVKQGPVFEVDELLGGDGVLVFDVAP